MRYENFTSNSVEGDIFIYGIIDSVKKHKIAQDKFLDFILSEGFSSWHIHNGWVMHKYENGDILHHREIRIRWFASAGGYYHSWQLPSPGEKMVIIENSPSGDELKKFAVYEYNVTSVKTDAFSNEILLSLIGIRPAIFNPAKNKYEFYLPGKSLFQRIVRALFIPVPK